MMQYLLFTDIGISNPNTILTDLKVNVLAQDLQKTDILTPQPMQAKQWPYIQLDSDQASIKNPVDKSDVDAKHIKTIAISGLYGGSDIPLNADIKPSRPCMIWMNRRAQQEND